MRPALLALLAACSSRGTEPPPAGGTTTSGGDDSSVATTSTTGSGPTTTPQPTSVWTCRTDIPDADLTGNYPPTELPPPDFTATNLDGAARTKADLMGHVTVMWFYPAASTAG